MTDTKTDKIIIEPMATPYRAFIPVDPEEIQGAMDKYWGENRDLIIKSANYKGKKEKGGKPNYSKARKSIEGQLGTGRLYGLTFSDIASEKVIEDTGKDVMLVNNVSYHTDSDPTLMVNFYFYPKLTVDQDIDFKMDRPTFPTFEEEYAGRLKDLKWQKRTRDTIEEVTQDSEVVVDVITTKDGKAHAPETIKAYRKEVKFLEMPDVAKSLPGKKVGDGYEIEDQREDNLFKHQIKIHECYSLTVPEESDPVLFENEEFSTIEEFKEKCEKESVANIKKTTDELVYGTIINQAIKVSKMEAIPQKYLDIAINNMMKQHGAESEELRQMIGQQVLRGIVQRMAADWWIRENGLGKDAEYEDVLASMHKNVEWVE